MYSAGKVFFFARSPLAPSTITVRQISSGRCGLTISRLLAVCVLDKLRLRAREPSSDILTAYPTSTRRRPEESGPICHPLCVHEGCRQNPLHASHASVTKPLWLSLGRFLRGHTLGHQTSLGMGTHTGNWSDLVAAFEHLSSQHCALSCVKSAIGGSTAVLRRWL